MSRKHARFRAAGFELDLWADRDAATVTLEALSEHATATEEEEPAYWPSCAGLALPERERSHVVLGLRDRDPREFAAMLRRAADELDALIAAQEERER